MSIHFHKIPVKTVTRETADCVSIELDIPVSLKNIFQYKQGQNLTFRTYINNEEIRRTYSLCSSPLENKWKVAVKKVEGGLFSGFANDTLKAGDTLDVMEPVGRFYSELHHTHKKNYLAFAAGSGITPILSIIKTTLKTEPESQFTLVYGNKNHNSVIFLEELEALKNSYINRFTLIHLFSRERTDTPLHSGRIDTNKLTELSRIVNYAQTDEFFLCGPEEMIFGIRDYLVTSGINEKKIHFELFNTGSSVKTRRPEKHTGSGPGTQSIITIKTDGRQFDISLPFNSETSVLDAALQHGASLPYACKGGMCCTCKARLLEGEVTMDVHWGLEEEEIEKGYILTCQSHPRTEKLVIDFDIK